MAYWVGVVGSSEGVERLRSQAETWWCISSKAQPGDFLAIYVAKNRLQGLPEDQGGFVSIFEIMGPEPDRATDCRKFGGSAFGSAAPVPVKISVKDRFPKSLRLQEMKRDKVLSAAKFVRRSFQGTYFAASAVEFSRIRKLLEAKREEVHATPGESEEPERPKQ